MKAELTRCRGITLPPRDFSHYPGNELAAGIGPPPLKNALLGKVKPPNWGSWGGANLPGSTLHVALSITRVILLRENLLIVYLRSGNALGLCKTHVRSIVLLLVNICTTSHGMQLGG